MISSFFIIIADAAPGRKTFPGEKNVDFSFHPV